MDQSETSERSAPSATPYLARLLGSFRLLAGGADCTPKGRKARALIAYLIAARGERLRRDRLATLLWGDRTDEQARASLRQALAEIRGLGRDQPSPILIDREYVRLDPAHIHSDLDLARSYAAAGEITKLAAILPDPPELLYAGLDDLDSGFDEWLARERASWRSELGEMALAGCRAALVSADLHSARKLARVLVANDPLDENAIVISMEVAAAAGDRAAVRRLFASLGTVLREELGIAPSQRTVEAHDRLLATMAVSPQPPSIAEPTPALHGEASPSADGQRPAVRRRPALLWAIALAMAIGASLLVWRRTHPVDQRPSIVVEPFRTAPGDRVARTLAEGISTALSQAMVGTGSSPQIIDAGDDVDGKTRPDFLIGGEAITSDGRISATVRLESPINRSVIWSARFVRPAGEIDALIQQIGLQIGRELRCWYDNGRYALVQNDAELARLSLAMCGAVGRDFNEAGRYAAQVVARAPGFARGWAEYAASVAIAGSTLPPDAQAASDRRARAYAQRAIALDPAQGLAYFAIATTLHGPAHWLERDRIIRQGLRADPDNGELNAARAEDLARIGRLGDAIGYIEHSFAVDHFLPGKLRELVDIHAEAGDLDRARSMLVRGKALWPDNPWFDDLAYKLSSTWGDPREAVRLLRQRTDPTDPDERAMEIAFLDWRADPSAANARKATDLTDRVARQSGVTLALVERLGALGRIDEAYHMAEKLPASAASTTRLFRQSFASARADPRFIDLAAKLGLVAIWQTTGTWPDFCSAGSLPYDCKVEAARASERLAKRTAPARAG